MAPERQRETFCLALAAAAIVLAPPNELKLLKRLRGAAESGQIQGVADRNDRDEGWGSVQAPSASCGGAGRPFHHSTRHIWSFALCPSFVGNTEIEIDIKRYYCKAGIKSIQVRRAPVSCFQVSSGPRASPCRRIPPVSRAAAKRGRAA